MSENLIFCRNQRLGRHSDKICYESPTKNTRKYHTIYFEQYSQLAKTFGICLKKAFFLSLSFLTGNLFLYLRT